MVFSGRIVRLAENRNLAKEAEILCNEANLLEANLREFEKYMDTGFSRSGNGKTIG